MNDGWNMRALAVLLVGLAVSAALWTGSVASTDNSDPSLAATANQQLSSPMSPSGVRFSEPREDGLKRFLINFDEPGLIDLHRQVRSSDRERFNLQEPLIAGESAAMATRHQSRVADIGSALGRSLDVSHFYQITHSGIAAWMTASEARAAAELGFVQSVERERLYSLDTFAGPEFIGAGSVWDGSATPSGDGLRGEGMIAAVLDSGIVPDHPSFINDPDCGHGIDGTPDKLISFVDCSSTDVDGLCAGTNPVDTNGHGTHVAGTVAGNLIGPDADPAPAPPGADTISGVAYCAHIRNYKVCPGQSCPFADIQAGMNHVLAHGDADTMNFSISGGANPWTDNDRRKLDLVDAGVFVNASAGNTSQAVPNPVGQVNHRGPWVMSVAASTRPGGAPDGTVSVTGPGTPPGNLVDVVVNSGSNSAIPDGVLEAEVRFDPDQPAGADGCDPGFPADFFDGAIALVHRGACAFTEKINNAAAAGAVMVLIRNNEAGVLNMNTSGQVDVLAYSMQQAPGNALRDFIEANPGATLEFVPDDAPQGDVLAGFSFRGPTPAPLQNLQKPDITAPGVDIYAAHVAGGGYANLSGTSMSGPHLSGAAVLVRQMQPEWTPTEVGSAIRMSAKKSGFKENGTTSWDWDDVGSGRVDLTTAGLAGLVMHETTANFLAANPASGGDVRTLNLPAVRDLSCSPDCSFTRTVRNTIDEPTSWSVSSEVLSGSFEITVSPESFDFSGDLSETQTLEITLAPIGGTPLSFGTIDFSEAGGLSPDLHFTVAMAGLEGDPEGVTGFDFEGTVTGITGTTTWASDLVLEITSPSGASFVVGGFQTGNPAWDFDGAGSTDDGTYESTHPEAFFPGTDLDGEWELVFEHSFGAGVVMNWDPIIIELTGPGREVLGVLEVPPFDIAGGASTSFTIPVGDVPPPPEEPAIEVDPASISETLNVGASIDRTLNIANVGDATLDWEIDATPLVLMRPGATVTIPSTSVPSGVSGVHADATQAGGLASRSGSAGTFNAPLGGITITHSDSDTIAAGNTVACSPDGGVTTSDNLFLRTFTLSDFGITETFNVSEVTFGIENLSESQPITVNLYTLEGDFVFGNLTLIGSGSETFSSQTLSLVSVPVTAEVDPSATLVVEIAPPNLAGVAAFFPGSNSAGETAPSYIASAACSLPEPTPFAGIGFPQVQLVMSVSGTLGDPVACGLPDWLTIDPLSGSVDADDSQAVTATLNADGLSAGIYEANICVTSNDPANPLVQVPVTLEVEGDPATIQVTPPQVDAFVEAGGPSVDFGLNVANLGDGDLEWAFEAGDRSATGTLLRTGSGLSSRHLAHRGHFATENFLRDLNVQRGEVGFHELRAPASGATLTHSASMDIVAGNTSVCSTDNGATTRSNAFLRIFDLADFGIFDAFEVEEVTFGIESNNVEIDVDVNIYTLDGMFLYENMELIGSTTTTLEPSSLTLVNVPVSAFAEIGSTIVVEVQAPNLSGIGSFRPGSNQDGETAPSYIVAPACNVPEPTSFDILGFSDVNLVMSVTGQTDIICAAPNQIGWLDADVTGGTVVGGSSQQVTLTLNDDGQPAGTELRENLCIASNDAENSLVVVPTTLSVVDEGDTAPMAEVNPASVSAAAIQGDTVSESVTVSNLGTANLDWSLQNVFGGSDVVLSENFAGSFPPAGWSSVNLAPTPAQNWARTEGTFNSAPASAARFFGGSGDGTQDDWLITPSITLGDNSQLTFADRGFDMFFYGGSFVQVSTGSCDPADGDFVPVAEINDSIDNVWREGIQVDLSGFDNQEVCIAFNYVGFWAHAWWIDDVLVTSTLPAPSAGCYDFDEDNWLAVSPESGTINPSGQQVLDVTFNTGGLAPGLYETDLCLFSNDLGANPARIPVTFDVIEFNPIADITPDQFSFEVFEGFGENDDLFIGNIGTTPLTWSVDTANLLPGLSYADAVDRSVATPNLPVGWDRASGIQSEGEVDHLVLGAQFGRAIDGPIEEGFDDVASLPTRGWVQANLSQPVGTNSWFQGNPAVFTAFEGDDDSYIAVNFASTSGAGLINNWLLTPETVLRNGTEIRFYTRADTFSDFFPDRLEVRYSTNGNSINVGSSADDVGDFVNLVASINPDLQPGGYPTEWTEVVVRLEGLPEPVAGRVALRYFVEDGGPSGTNSNYIGVDSFSITQPIACEFPGEVDWLSLSFFRGSHDGYTLPGDTDRVTVNVDSSGLALGDYEAKVCVSTNDPAAPLVEIPVSLTVLGIPIADIDPESFSFTLLEGESDGGVLDISNIGDGVLEWLIEEEPVATSTFFGRDAHNPDLDETLNVPDFSVTGAAGGGNVETFEIEAGIATSGPVVGFTFEGTVVLDGGDWASDMTMVITSPAGESFSVGGFSGPVNLWEFQGSGSASDGTYVSSHFEADDGSPVFAADGTGDAGTWTISFTHGWNSDFAGTMDWTDVTITLHKTGTGDPGPGPDLCEGIDSVSWLSFSPASGMTPAGETDPVDVTVDATGLSGGVYEANLCVTTNEPVGGLYVVPVTLTVASRVEGTVQSLGYCSDDPFPAEGATITVEGQFDTYSGTADETGAYRVDLPVDESPVDVTASAPDHFSETVVGVTLSATAASVVDFDLVLDSACATVNPDLIIETIDDGGSRVVPIDIGNVDGAAALEWSIFTAGLDSVDPRAHFPQIPYRVEQPGNRADVSALAEEGLGAPLGSGGLLQVRNGVPAYSTTGWTSPGYIVMDALVPDVWTLINATQPTNIFAGAFIDNDFSVQYGLATGGGALPADTMIAIDTDTGTFTQLGSVTGGPGATWTSMKWDHSTSTLYAMALDELYTIDLGTLEATLVGPIQGGTVNPAPVIISMAISLDGLMYGIDIVDDVFIAIDKTTGESSVIGSLGFAPSFAQDMDFDHSDGTLYWAGYFGGGNSQILTIDLETGAATSLGAIDDGAEMLSFSIAVQGLIGDCAAPESLPWLSVDPDSGTTDVGATDTVNVTLNASGIPAGTYEAAVCIDTNDSFAGTLVVPVLMEVPAGDDDAFLEGTVQSLGYCSDDVTLVEGAMVEVVGQNTTFTTTTDANGLYQLMFDVSESPVSITVSAPDHISGLEEDVIVAAQETTVADFDLLLDEACATVDPESFTVSLPIGGADTFDLTIDNTAGAADLNWDLVTDGLASAGLAIRDQHDPGLDEVLEVPAFTLPPQGQGTVDFTVPGGVTSNGTVVGFTFEGTVSGITGTGTWASDMNMVITSPEGVSFDVGGFLGDNPWDFNGAVSDNDGTYVSVHIGADVFGPEGTVDAGDWQMVFTHTWNDPMDWEDMTITLHKEALPLCIDPEGVDWLSVNPASGSTAAGETSTVEVSVDTDGLAPGDYQGAVCLTSDDAVTPLVVVPFDLTVEAPDPARLQVAHLAPVDADGTAVDVALNGDVVLPGFEYGDSTAYLDVPPGTYLIEIFPAGGDTPLLSIPDVELEEGVSYTALANGDISNQDFTVALLVDDTDAPAAGNFKLRLGHLAPFADDLASAEVRLADGTLLAAVDFGDIGGFVELAAGEYDLQITAPGGDPVLINPEPVTFADGDVISAFAVGNVSNEPLGVFALPAGVEGFFLPLVPDPGVLEVDMTEHDFGPVLIGEQSTVSMTATNAAAPGSMSMTMDQIGLSGDPVFVDSGGDCVVGMELAPGESCTLTVDFVPTAAQEYTGQVTMEANGQMVAVDLTGRGFDRGALGLSDEMFDFGDVLVGNSSSAELILTNMAAEGSAAVVVDSIDIPTPGDFAITGGSCEAGTTSLEVGETCTIVVTFAPLTAGEVAASLLVEGSDGKMASAQLNGQGVEPGDRIFDDRFEVQGD